MHWVLLTYSDLESQQVDKHDILGTLSDLDSQLVTKAYLAYNGNVPWVQNDKLLWLAVLYHFVTRPYRSVSWFWKCCDSLRHKCIHDWFTTFNNMATPAHSEKKRRTVCEFKWYTNAFPELISLQRDLRLSPSLTLCKMGWCKHFIQKSGYTEIWPCCKRILQHKSGYKSNHFEPRVHFDDNPVEGDSIYLTLVTKGHNFGHIYRGHVHPCCVALLT